MASLIAKRGNLSTDPTESTREIEEIKLDELSDKDLETSKLLDSSLIIFLAMGLGTIMQTLIEKVGITFPNYVGAMVVAVIIRNVADHTEKIDVHLDEIEALGQICLTIFVSMALISIKLWELVDLAIPMFVILITQVVFIGAFMYFIGFHVLGGDYDACVMVSGVCGFALGAMSNAVTNMKAFTEEWGDSPLAMVIVPGVGSVFIDFFNIGILTIFINLLA